MAQDATTKTAAKTYRETVREIADPFGFVTTAAARKAGVPTRALWDLTRWGNFEHVGYGLFRFFDDMTGFETYQQRLMGVGAGAYLIRDAVLALHGLANVIPPVLRVGTPRKPRRQLPPHTEVYLELRPQGEITTYFGMRCTTVFRALVESEHLAPGEHIVDGAFVALREGLITKAEHAEVLRVIEERDRVAYEVEAPLLRLEAARENGVVTEDEYRDFVPLARALARERVQQFWRDNPPAVAMIEARRVPWPKAHKRIWRNGRLVTPRYEYFRTDEN